MLTSPISFDRTMRELFEYPDPSFPFVVWSGDFGSFSDKTMVCHWHKEFEYGVLLSGELDYYIDGQHIRAKRGDAVFVNSNIIHMAANDAANDAKIFTVSFLPTLFAGGDRGKLYLKYFQPILQSGIRGFSITSATQNGRIILELLNELFELDNDPPDDYELACLGIVSRLWSATMKYVREHRHEFLRLRRKRDNEEQAKDILRYIHEHYAENLRIETIARKTCISRSEVFRCFQKYTGQNPIGYLNEYRLSHAVNLLLETDKTVTQIALECGFSSSSYFGKIFKSKYAISPARFRDSRSLVGISQ